VPAWFEAFIERLMAKARDERFQSAAEVAELLSRELAHLQDPRRHPAPPRPWLPRRRQRFWASRRKRATAVVAAAVVGAALTAAAWSIVGWVGGPPATQHGGAIGARPTANPLYEPPTATMWTADGFEAAAEYANALEAEMLCGEAVDSPESASLDPWALEMIMLQRGVSMADGEPLFPEMKRIEP
jgi:hypothetical protein